uniref:Uncharacterized protein n=1 Tax=Anopheles dirus TaxID=7168 RepID=A0A182MZF8_9DIPT
MHSINLESYDDEGLAKSTGSGIPSPVERIAERLEDQESETFREAAHCCQKSVETDENDNSSRSREPLTILPMRPTPFERILYRTEQHGGATAKSGSMHTSPDRRARPFASPSSSSSSSPSPPSKQQPQDMKLEPTTATNCSPSSGIIFHRTYNKKPAQQQQAAIVDDDHVRRSLSPAVRPVIRLEDIRWRIAAMPGRHGNEQTNACSNRTNNAKSSCIIRRSFHKDSTVVSNIAKISLDHESSHSEGAEEDTRRRAHDRSVDSKMSPAAGEGMEVCDEGESHDREEDQPQDDAVEASSMANSYGDEVCSSGWSKHFSTQHSSTHVRKPAGERGAAQSAPSEFDLMLQKINQSVPPMSHLDRIDQWRVTAEDLLHSIPTKAQIETPSGSSSGAKRPRYYDDAEHAGTSDDDSDTLEDDAATAGANSKKRRTVEDAATPPLLDSPHATAITSRLVLRNADDEDDGPNGLDFRSSQVNPEIDKPQLCTAIRILTRKNYYKLPTRGTRHEREAEEDGSRTSGGTSSGNSSGEERRQKGNPYAYLLSRDEEEREKFLQYLRISPVFRSDEQLAAGGRGRSGQMEQQQRIANALLESKVSTKMQKSVPPAAGPLKARAKSRPKQAKRRKPPCKGGSRAHPSIIASSGLRGVRRLVLSSSLRSGKIIRYRNSAGNVRSLATRTTRGTTVGKKLDGHNRLPLGKKAEKVQEKHDDVPPEAMEDRPPKQQQQQLASPVPSASSKKVKTGRCSVDSAVSSSTSAEMHERRQQVQPVAKQSKECQTVETIPPIPVAPAAAVVNEGKRMRNPLNRADGDVLHLFLLGEQLVVVQKELVSFWRYSRLSVLLGVKQEWQRVAQIRRWNRDTEVDTQNANRIVFNQQDPIYLEPRARNLSEDKSRTCPLASIYLNAYFLETSSVTKVVAGESVATIASGDDANRTENGEDDCEELLRLKSFQLDTVKSSLEDIRFVPLPNTRDFLVCWHEHVSELESRTGLCKYSLTPDLQTLACIREFVIVKQKLTTLRCINDKKLVGLGRTTVHIWCYESGFLLRTVDLKLELGLIVCCFLHIEEADNTLVMWQMQQPEESAASCNRKLMKMIAINLSKPTWYIAHSYEIALASLSITSESQQWALDHNNASYRHCLTFDSGELLLLSLNDPTACWTNHQRLEKDLQRADSGSLHIYSRLRSNEGTHDLYRPRERILNGGHWNGGRDLVFLSDQFLTVKAIDEYMLEESKR